MPTPAGIWRGLPSTKTVTCVCTWKTSLAFCSHLMPSTLSSVVAFDPAGASSGAFGIGTSSPPSFPGAGAGSSVPSVESGAKCDTEAVEVVPPYPPPPHAAHSSATAASTDAAQSHSRRVTSDVGRARADQLADCAVRDQHGIENLGARAEGRRHGSRREPRRSRASLRVRRGAGMRSTPSTGSTSPLSDRAERRKISGSNRSRARSSSSSSRTSTTSSSFVSFSSVLVALADRERVRVGRRSTPAPEQWQRRRLPDALDCRVEDEGLCSLLLGGRRAGCLSVTRTRIAIPSPSERWWLKRREAGTGLAKRIG